MDGPYIFTFFASRDGIGRSMAVMNTAYSLAMSGRNVLAIDTQKGLIPMFKPIKRVVLWGKTRIF